MLRQHIKLQIIIPCNQTMSKEYLKMQNNSQEQMEINLSIINVNTNNNIIENTHFKT